MLHSIFPIGRWHTVLRQHGVNCAMGGKEWIKAAMEGVDHYAIASALRKARSRDDQTDIWAAEEALRALLDRRHHASRQALVAALRVQERV